MKTENKKSKIYEIDCPECKTGLIIEVSKDVIVEAVKGEYEEIVEVKKSSQFKLT